ncbi:putative quinol monooxygenase [Cupriavidus basilensis]
MLTVIAHIQTLPGARDRVHALFDALVPTVLAESGCRRVPAAGRQAVATGHGNGPMTAAS